MSAAYGSLISTLATQCSDLAQHLAGKEFGFKLSLKVSSIGFDFFVDRTLPRQSGGVPVKKKKSPSAVARDAERMRSHRAKKQNTEKNATKENTPKTLAATAQEFRPAAATAQEAGENLFPCEVCGKHFQSTRGLNTHKRVHQVPPQEPVQQPTNDKIDSPDVSGGMGNHKRVRLFFPRSSTGGWKQSKFIIMRQSDDCRERRPSQ